MAAHAQAREETLRTAGGIGPGARIVDLGCDPGTFLPELARRAGPLGRVAGVDGAEEAVRTAGALIGQLDLRGRQISYERASRTPAWPRQLRRGVHA